MVALTFLLVLILDVAHSSIIQSHVNRQSLPLNSGGIGTSQSNLGIVQSIVLGAIASHNDQSDDTKSVIDTAKDVVADVADKVADVVTDVIDNNKDVVDDLIGNVKDKISDIIDKAKDGGSSHHDVDDSRKGDVGRNETADTSSDVDAVDSDEHDGKNSTESDRTSREDDDDDKSKDDSRKVSSNQNTQDKESNDDINKGDSNENNNDKTDNRQAVNGTDDSGERQENESKNKNGGQSLDKDDSKSVWSWLKSFTDNDVGDSEDDDTKMKRYLTQMSKVKGYLDAIDSSIAASQAKQSGTCPIYPVQVGNNRVTITTQNGCKIIIKLKGVVVDKIEGGRVDHKTKKTKRSVLVSYAGDN